MAKEMGKVEIEGKEFTLFYDYDQLRDRKLSKLSDDGKIEWFQLRMELVFLEPLRRIFNTKSVAYYQLNSPKKSSWPRAAFMTAAFSILLNGIEALGSFIPHDKEPIEKEHYRKNKSGFGNYFLFRAFIREYMRDWDDEAKGTSYTDKKTGNLYRRVYLPLILWDKFRNSIAHSFVVEGGGIDYKADPTGWVVEANGYLEIGPGKFFKDFLSGADNFFNDVRTTHKKEFLKSFKDAYPC